MKVCIVGGIFDKPEEYRMRHLFAPEAVLSNGLRLHEIDVVTSGHKNFDPNVDCDVVHVHHLGRGSIKQAISNTSSVFVYTSHDPLLVSSHKLSWPRVVATNFVFNRSDAVVVLSNRELMLMHKRFRGCPKYTVVIPNGLPSDVFYWSNNIEQSVEPYKLLFVGQLIPQKGVDILLSAFEDVSKSYNVVLFLAYQTSSLEKYYKEMVERLGICDKVEFLGFKSAFELADLYRSVDLFVLPSYAEALPTVISEALMCGAPVISTDVAGIPDQVGEYGYIVKPGDIKGLAKGICSVINNMSHLKNMAGKRSKYATERFSISAMIEGHIKLYSSLLKECKKPRRHRRRFYFTNVLADQFIRRRK